MRVFHSVGMGAVHSTHANRFALVELELSTFPGLVSDAFLKLENIEPDKIKVSETGK